MVITLETLPNGDIKETRTIPGAAPLVWINGVIQGPKPRLQLTWSKWFAWYPVRLNGHYVIFKTIYRRAIPKTYVTIDDWTRYEYGTIFDVLND